MQVELDLPDDTVRKLRAFNILLGGSENIDNLLIKMIDDTLTDRIIEAASGGRPRVVSVVPAQLAPSVQTTHNAGIRTLRAPEAYEDPTGISDGLGDPEPAARAQRRRKEPPNQTVVQGGVGDAELASDMELADPEHEAKVDAPTWEDQVGAGELAPTAEEAFAFAAQMPAPVHVPEPDLRMRGRATVNKKHVSAFTGSEQHRL